MWHESNTHVWCIYEKQKTSFLGQSIGHDKMDNDKH